MGNTPAPATSSGASTTEIRAALAALAAAGAGWLVLLNWPGLETTLFARAAARGAGLLCGSPVLRVAEGWQLPAAQTPLLVSAACSGTDYFLIVAALLGWRLARSGRPPWLAAPIAVVAAAPVAIAVNALRLAALAQAHRWFIPLVPETYAHYLHLLTGVAVFLPALIGLHLFLEYHERHRAHPHA